MKNFLVALVVFATLFTGTLALAGHEIGHVSGTSLEVNTRLENPIKADSFSDLVSTLIASIVFILFPFLVLAFIYIGFLFVKAQGKPEEIEEAQRAFFWTVVGAFILMGAWGFSKIIESTVDTLR